MSTVEKKEASQGAGFVKSLQRFSEILPKEKLLQLQQLAEQEALTDEALEKEVGRQGVFLLAFAAAAVEAPDVIRSPTPALHNRIQELIRRVQSSAPSLLAYPRIKSLARRFVTRAPREESVPFDDVDGFRATVNHLDLDGELTPTVRVQVSFTNRETLPVLSLRLVDMAFLARGLLGSLGSALESALRLSRAGLLDESEIRGVRKYLGDVIEEVGRIRTLVDQLPNDTEPAASEE